ncbi:hypothetical protein BpHYR1_011294 [Brachionus plicatilis]|uniref:Uncharacterized protein n=1 Tax=Brachionus plicatilis TaxID=10195 RepID=A0A3M7QTG3_BRAPC|nr:hypothetical protein BpHYR1_011294 [Brachionus plicatilis]
MNFRWNNIEVLKENKQNKPGMSVIFSSILSVLINQFEFFCVYKMPSFRVKIKRNTTSESQMIKSVFNAFTLELLLTDERRWKY